MSKHKTTNLVHEAFTSLLARAAKYNDPQNLEWDWERTDRMERHAINPVLDLVEVEKQRDALLEALRKAQRLLIQTLAVVYTAQIQDYLPGGFKEAVIDATITDSLCIDAAIRKATEVQP